ncbi:unnamed protein product [Discosporangium mesarthrocarpum]
MERIMKAQTLGDTKNMMYMIGMKTMEINPRHPIIHELNKRVEMSPDDEATKDLAWLLFDTAMASSGFTVDDTEAFSARVYRSMASTLNIESLEPLEEAEVPEEEEEVEVRL